MSTAAATHHLLFGILSLQNGFVTKEDLVAATSLWLEDKSVSLAALLEQRFGMAPEVRALIDALVDKHMQLHDGDIEQSLAAISSIGSVRDELLKLGDTDVQAGLTLLPEGTLMPHGVEVAANGHGTLPGRYRILRPHARGGLGKVSVAQDEELQREVALKELLPVRADVPDSRARFLREAQITGQLEHPGVVPVYGLGQYADGRPYYAMRFVRGDSLQEAIVRYHSAGRRTTNPEERSLELRKLLGRFIDVCDAIDYAHSRHILHRDLKPGNIMIGNYGETLVVDWGLAKNFEETEPSAETIEGPEFNMSGDDSVPTQLGTAVGTPAYMSPEQAAGRLEVMGPAADIYGLGATLHCLLTGKPPVSGASVEETLSKVQRGEVPSPIQIDPYVPKPLDAICRRAMALSPAARYATARLLADDVERWMADESVSALPDSISAKLARWGRRNRTKVQSAGFALVVIAAVSTVAAFMVNHWRKTAETALVAESAAKAKTEEALTAETAAKAEAVDQRDRANQNFALARGAVDNLFTEVSESALLNQPGTQPLRRGLLEQARNYYDTFLSTEADNEQLADELAASQFRVGRIIELTESKEEALDVYAEVAEQQRELVAESPDDLDRLAALSTTINAIGRTNHELQQIDEAQANYDEARQLREQLVALDPDNHEFHRLAANSTMNLGLVTRDLGDPDRAAQLVGESIDKRLERIERGDRRATLRRDLAMGYFNLALLAVLRGEQDAAREPLLKAVEVFESLDSESGDNSGNDDTDADVDKIANLHRLAISYRLLGDLQFSDVTSEEAEQWYENARYRLEQLVLQNPTVSRYESDLANLMINQADREARRDDLAAARESFQRSSDIQMRLWERFGEPAYLFNAAVATREMALTQWQLGEDDQARETLENLAALLRRQDGEFDDELAAIDEALEMVDNEGEAESPAP